MIRMSAERGTTLVKGPRLDALGDPRRAHRSARALAIRLSHVEPPAPVARRAVVLLSGGMDSATCAYVARQEGYEVHALSFDYGQRNVRELDAARAVADAVGAAEHVVMSIALSRWGGSALTDPAIPMPAGRRRGGAPEALPLTYVPARNMVFLSCALSYAETVGATAIYVGLVAGYPHLPDSQPAFLVAFDEAARLGTRAGVEGHPIAIETPLLFMSKADIVALGSSLGLDYGQTWSCYEGGERPCEVCDACRFRAAGFIAAGISDPLVGRGREA